MSTQYRLAQFGVGDYVYWLSRSHCQCVFEIMEIHPVKNRNDTNAKFLYTMVRHRNCGCKDTDWNHKINLTWEDWYIVSPGPQFKKVLEERLEK